MCDLEEYKERLVYLAFNLKADEFIAEVEQNGLPSDLLKDVPQSEGADFPLQLIVQCWEIALWSEEEWSEKVREVIRKKIANCKRIKEYLCSKHGIEMPTIDFYNSKIHFFRDDPEDSFDDVFLCDKERVLKAHKELDAELYVAVNKFDFENAERLLKLGANPNEEFPEMDDDTCFSRVLCECSYLEIELEITKDIDLDISEYELRSLFGYAAHESMYQLLNKYDK